MERSSFSLLEDFLEQNSRKPLGQPDRFKALFLDFSQNEYRPQ